MVLRQGFLIRNNMNIKVIADGMAYCGISQYVRSIVKALIHGGHKVVYHHVNNYGDSKQEQEVQWLLDLRTDDVCDIELYICNPFEHYVPLETSIPKAGLFFFEASLTKDMADKIRSLDIILAPSLYCQEIFAEHGIDAKYIPFYVDIPEYSDEEIAAFGLDFKDVFKDKCIFFSNFTWQYRKGYDLLLRAWWRAFDKSDNAVLVIKTQCDITYQKLDPIKEEIGYLKMMNGISSPFKQIEGDVADIALIVNKLTDVQMQSLYKMADFFVLPTRGEGLGLPFVEACYFNVPILAPNHGGHLDFLSDDNAWMVGGKMVPCMNMPGAVNRELEPNFTCRQNWFECNVINLSRYMREMYKLWQDKSPFNLNNDILLDFNINRTSQELTRFLSR